MQSVTTRRPRWYSVRMADMRGAVVVNEGIRLKAIRELLRVALPGPTDRAAIELSDLDCAVARLLDRSLTAPEIAAELGVEQERVLWSIRRLLW